MEAEPTREAPTLTPQAPLVGPVSIPGYEILGEIGRGGMGVVYRARDLALDREVAVKILQEQYAPGSPTARRFVAEAQITGQLQHPSIPAIYQVGALADERSFLAMKLIKGDTLADLLQAKTPINTLAVFEAMCQAVGYAHAHDVIHRDLKPANIMIGAFGEVQVMDWGLAKILDRFAATRSQARAIDPDATTAPTAIRSGRAAETQAGSVMGTPAYMAPEQAAGENHKVDQRTDVFGLGAILCVLLTGKPPIGGSDAEEVRLNALRGKTEEALARLDACAAEPEVVALCKRCLAVESALRPADASVLAKDVARLRAAAEERARQAELDRARAEVRGVEQRKRRRVLLIAVGSLAVMLLLGVAGTTIGMFQAKRAKDAESRRAETEETAKLAAQTARDQAQQRYTMALAAFNQMVHGIQSKLENRPGTQELRKDLLENARAGLKKLLQEAEKQGNPDSTLVWSYLRMGDVELVLGNTMAAQKEYQAGFEIAQGLADAEPKNAQAQRDLGLSLEKLGDVTLPLGQTKDALDFYRKSLDVAQRLADAEPKDAQAQRDLSVTFDRLGDVTLRLGHTQDALAFYRNSLDIRQRLADADPKNARAHRDLTISFDRLGDVTLRQGRTQDALDFYRKSLDIRQRLADADPGNAQARRDLSVTFNKLGDTTLQLGQTQDGLAFYRKGLDSAQQLADADPRNAQAQRDLGIGFERLGNVSLQLGQAADALDFYRKYVNITQRLAAADPKNVQTQRDLGVGFNKLGDTTLQLGQNQDALDFYRKSLDIRQRLADADPNNAQARGDLCFATWKIAGIYHQQGDYTSARAWYEKAEILAIGFSKPGFYPVDLPWIRQQIVVCQRAEKAIADLEFVFTPKSADVSTLAGIRVRALRKRNQFADMIATAERFAAWVEKLENDRARQRYNAACLFALCAAENMPDALVDKVITLLAKAEAGGYFTPEKIAYMKRDSDFDGLQTHPKFVQFMQELAAKK